MTAASGSNTRIINDNVSHVLGPGPVNTIGTLSKISLATNGTTGMARVPRSHNNPAGRPIPSLVVTFLAGGATTVDHSTNCCCHEYPVIMCTTSANRAVTSVAVSGTVVGYRPLGTALANVAPGGVSSHSTSNLTPNCKMIVVTMYAEANSAEQCPINNHQCLAIR